MITAKRDEIDIEVRAAINDAVARGVIYSGRHEITGAVRNGPSFIDGHVNTLIAATIITPVNDAIYYEAGIATLRTILGEIRL